MESVNYGKKQINFEIRRGKRQKTVTIQLNPSGIVSVLAPELVSEERIRTIVQKKAKWIIDRQDSIGNKRVFNTAKEFVSGETFVYLGKRYRLKVVKTGSNQNGKCELAGGRLRVEIGQNDAREKQKETVRKSIVSWYLAQADNKFRERVDYYSPLIGNRPRVVEIKEQKKRWGSCSCNGIVRFNWKIVMTPISVVDYVIVHELCHLIFPHHSPQFWEKVASIIPAYGKRRVWLKHFSSQLDIFTL
jgi:predicted metal-dependent hydrolase